MPQLLVGSVNKNLAWGKKELEITVISPVNSEEQLMRVAI